MGLRRDRIGADHLRPAQRNRPRHRLGAFDLLEHRRETFSSGPQAAALAATSACAALAASTLASPTLPGKARRIASRTLSSETTPTSAAKAPSKAVFGAGRPTNFSASSVAGTALTCPAGSRATTASR